MQINGNRATGSGGAIFVDAQKPSGLLVERSEIRDNVSSFEIGRY